uniref:Zona pellucida sperm-binding protein 3 n=1 Tax=Denticeps clupeoides TaxID=299321 RepID=A0AAY4CAW8_9TELE
MPRRRFPPVPRLCPLCLGRRFPQSPVCARCRPQVPAVPRLCPGCRCLRFPPVPRLCPGCRCLRFRQSPVCARDAAASGSRQSPVCARDAAASGSRQSPVCARDAAASGSRQSPFVPGMPLPQVPASPPFVPDAGLRFPPVPRLCPMPVAATCDENMVHVQVKKDLFGSGELIRASDISLGGCGVTGEDSVAQLLYFQSYLQACGSQVVMTNDTLVYSFSLTYIPTAASNTSAPIVRSSGAVIGIECHYLRFHNVSSNALQPAWIPYAATKIAQELLVFSLKLMTDDWQFERPSNVYYMGDLIHFEASVKQYNHVPLRVFVDSCLVTPYPYAASAPSYLFIQTHGCLVDSKLTGSSSRFLPRTQDFKLQFQLEAFRFQQGDTGSLYITCVLKATAAASPTDAEHKACSLLARSGLVRVERTNCVAAVMALVVLFDFGAPNMD